MKKIFCTVRNHGICTYNVLIMLLLFMFLQNSIYAQNIRGEFIGGFNLAQVDGDRVVGYRKIGFNGGFGAALPLAKAGMFQLKLFLIKKAHTKISFKL